MAEQPIATIARGAGQAYPGLGSLICKIPSDLTANACTVLELRLEPGQGAGLHRHTYEQELLFVHAGACTVGSAEQTWELTAGGWAVFPPGTAHFFRNNGEQACTLIITAVPGGLDRYFTALSAAVARQDAEAIAAVNTEYGIILLGG